MTNEEYTTNARELLKIYAKNSIRVCPNVSTEQTTRPLDMDAIIRVPALSTEHIRAPIKYMIIRDESPGTDGHIH